VKIKLLKKREDMIKLITRFITSYQLLVSISHSTFWHEINLREEMTDLGTYLSSSSSTLQVPLVRLKSRWEDGCFRNRIMLLPPVRSVLQCGGMWTTGVYITVSSWAGLPRIICCCCYVRTCHKNCNGFGSLWNLVLHALDNFLRFYCT